MAEASEPLGPQSALTLKGHPEATGISVPLSQLGSGT